jgi:hypothetical protein
MSIATTAIADPPPAAAAAVSAAALAARIPVPVRLPVRHLSVVRAVTALWLLGFPVAGMSSMRAWRRIEDVRKKRMKRWRDGVAWLGSATIWRVLERTKADGERS